MTRLERLRALELEAQRFNDGCLVRADDLAALLAVADAARDIDCLAPERCPAPLCAGCRLAAALAVLDGAADE